MIVNAMDFAPDGVRAKIEAGDARAFTLDEVRLVTAGVQAAIDRARDLALVDYGSFVVRARANLYFPGGVWPVDATLTVHDTGRDTALKLTVSGDGRGTEFVGTPALGSAPLFRLRQVGSNARDVIVRDLSARRARRLFDTFGLSYCRFDRLHLSDWAEHAIAVDGNGPASVQDCTFQYGFYGQDPERYEMGWAGSAVLEPWAVAATLTSTVSDLSVRGNHFGEDVPFGVRVSDASRPLIHDNRFAGRLTEDGSSASVQIAACVGAIVSGNHLGARARFHGGRGNLAQGNVLEWGAVLSGTFGQFTGNHLFGRPLELTYSAAGNLIAGNTGSGLPGGLFVGEAAAGANHFSENIAG